MSFAITGIQTNAVDFTFYAGGQSSGGAIHPPETKTTTDQDAAQFSSANTVKVGVVATSKAAPTPETKTPTASGIAAPVDTVTLSTTQKVQNLRNEGEGDTLIATTLNLPIKEVDGDLHLSTQVAQHQSFTVAPVTSPLTSSTVAETAHTVSTDA